jgi:hypothetical protein
MPFIRNYNGDSNIYGLKGHSTFMSVYKFRSFTKRNLRSSHTNSFSRKLLLPSRPSATKHRPNTFQPGTMLCFGSLEFMSLDGSYDMILLPPPRDSDNGGRQPARRWRNQ